MSDRELYCDICQGVVLFETPPRADGHGAEPEWSELACTGCGAALLIAGAAVRAPRRHRRPAHRRAA
ncbi:hypothetical protein [Micromonospora narathiwatensis]|uniref:Uncharacterized protein n=1 Tax=Micromonospora narathiwatensis TaxID=299146 RepID=A0A1A8ZXK1_9ACTN|nr:hypothetical protein [Micromonospora narathiwatensis]SBT48610.1 hypothetical protein GA0070621_3213 [Micromonospora narathiwatensis]